MFLFGQFAYPWCTISYPVFSKRDCTSEAVYSRTCPICPTSRSLANSSYGSVIFPSRRYEFMLYIEVRFGVVSKTLPSGSSTLLISSSVCIGFIRRCSSTSVKTTPKTEPSSNGNLSCSISHCFISSPSEFIRPFILSGSRSSPVISYPFSCSIEDRW